MLQMFVDFHHLYKSYILLTKQCHHLRVSLIAELLIISHLHQQMEFALLWWKCRI